MDPALRPVCVGEVVKAFFDKSAARFEWIISDWTELDYGHYRSGPVEYFTACWCFVIWVERHKITYVSLNRYLFTPGGPESVHCTIRWKDGQGDVRDIASEETIALDGRGWTVDIPLLSERTSPRRIVFSCILRRHVSPHTRSISSETQTEGTYIKGISRGTQTEDASGGNDKRPLEDISILQDHFKNLLLTGDDHDVLLKVKNEQFMAHKNILRARSPVFAAMFANDMAESAEGCVVIEDCDPDAFGEFLRYVYTGEVDFASARSALGLYYAADKYDFPKLKVMCARFLKISFTISTVFEVICLAAKHDEEELLQQAIVYFADNLEEVIITVEWQRFLLANPIQANEMSLKAVQYVKSSLNKK